MAIRVKLVRGLSGHPEDHRATVRGLGLTRVGRERILPDNDAVRGMVAKVGYLLEMKRTDEPFKPFGRRSLQKQQREAARRAGAKALAGDSK